jgi:hypothetical protein
MATARSMDGFAWGAEAGRASWKVHYSAFQTEPLGHVALRDVVSVQVLPGKRYFIRVRLSSALRCRQAGACSGLWQGQMHNMSPTRPSGWQESQFSRSVGNQPCSS